MYRTPRSRSQATPTDFRRPSHRLADGDIGRSGRLPPLTSLPSAALGLPEQQTCVSLHLHSMHHEDAHPQHQGAGEKRANQREVQLTMHSRSTSIGDPFCKPNPNINAPRERRPSTRAILKPQVSPCGSEPQGRRQTSGTPLGENKSNETTRRKGDGSKLIRRPCKEGYRSRRRQDALKPAPRQLPFWKPRDTRSTATPPAERPRESCRPEFLPTRHRPTRSRNENPRNNPPKCANPLPETRSQQSPTRRTAQKCRSIHPNQRGKPVKRFKRGSHRGLPPSIARSM